MEFQTKEKFKAELWSFFGLTILNLVIAALAMGLGISSITTNLFGMIDSSQFQLMSALLMAVGIVAAAAGFYWLIQVAQIIEGVGDLKDAYDGLSEGDGEQATGLFVKMLAYYRSNRSIVSRMTMLGRIGGILFVVVGAIGMAQAGASMASSGVLAENLAQLFGGVMAFGVGVAGFLISRYFSTYSKVWDARLYETELIEETLKQKLEAN